MTIEPTIETILMGGGILFLFFAIIGYTILPKWVTRHPVTKRTRLGLCISGFIFLAIGIIIGIKGPLMAPTPMPTPMSSQSPILPEIKIISPKEGDDVSVKSEVGVNFSGKVPEGQYMWVVVNPATSPLQWWPQGGIEPSKGIWVVKATFGQEKKDVGDKFNIAVILLNEKDNQFYKDYLKRGHETENYPPIPLPDSAKIIDKITVIRR